MTNDPILISVCRDIAIEYGIKLSEIIPHGYTVSIFKTEGGT